MSSDATKAALREALEGTGKLDTIKAQLRAIVFQALDSSTPDARTRPPPTPENLVINELIREYLEFNGYEHTLAVMRAEAALPEARVPRNIIAREVGCGACPASVPLLYGIVHEGMQSVQ